MHWYIKVHNWKVDLNKLNQLEYSPCLLDHFISNSVWHKQAILFYFEKADSESLESR